jgi:hypothetical protein
MLTVVLLSVIMLNVTYKPFMLSAIMLNFVMLCVVVPFHLQKSNPKFTGQLARAKGEKWEDKIYELLGTD